MTKLSYITVFYKIEVDNFKENSKYPTSLSRNKTGNVVGSTVLKLGLQSVLVAPHKVKLQRRHDTKYLICSDESVSNTNTELHNLPFPQTHLWPSVSEAAGGVGWGGGGDETLLRDRTRLEEPEET